MCATQISEKNKQKAIYLMLFLFFIYKYFSVKINQQQKTTIPLY